MSIARPHLAVGCALGEGAAGVVLLKCTSAYPARAEDANLRTIEDLALRFGVPVGLSDHTLGIEVPIVAVALGASLIEKHLTLSRSSPGPDSAFSLEPGEFADMVRAVRAAESALGRVHYGPTAAEQRSLQFRRSLFVVRDVATGAPFTVDNVRSIRPAHGLPPRDLPRVLSGRASCDVEAGTPLSWALVVLD